MDSRTLSIIIAATDKASEVFKRVQGRLGNVADTLRRTGERMQTMGRQLTRRVTMPIVGLGLAAAKAFMDFDDAMTQSLAIMGDVSSDMRKEMEETARTLAKETSVSAKEAAESYFFLASAGLDAKQSIAALPQVAKFAQAGMFDMARATDLATDAQSALGLTVKDAEENLENLTRVTDVLVGANTLANASVEQFSEALTNKGASALKIVNKDMEEGVAVLAAWADQGIKGSMAGNWLNIVLRDLQNAAINNAGVFERMKIEVFDAEGNMRNMAKVIGDMEKAFDGMSDKELRTSLSLLGFTDRSIAATASLLGMSDQIADYEKNLRGMAGMTEEVANKQMESFKQQLGLIKDGFIDMGITIAQRLEPFMRDFANFLKDVGDRFSNLDEKTQNFILVVAGLAAALGPALFVFGTFLKVLSGPAVLAFAGVAIAVFGIKKAFDNDLMPSMGDVIKRVSDLAEKVGDYLGPKVQRLWEVVRDDLIPVLRRLWKEVIEPILPVIGELFVGAIGLAIDAVALLVKGLSAITEAILDGNPFIWGLIGVLGVLSGALALKAGVAAFKGAMTTMTTRFVAFKALVASPIIVPALAIGALVGSIITILQWGEKAKGMLDDIAGKARDAMDAQREAHEAFQAGIIDAKEYRKQLQQAADAAQAARREAERASRDLHDMNAATWAYTQIFGSRPAWAKDGGFADGGFTGRGNASEIAGVVHRGEFVIPKDHVDQSRGVPKGMGNTFNFYGNIELGDRNAVDRFFERLDRQSTLADNGIGV